MNVTLAYLGRSALLNGSGPGVLSFAPNLAREPVAFDAALRQPLRFREAISALHDVVVSDLRFKPRDKSAYQEWKANERQRLSSLRRAAYQQAKQEILARRETPVPQDLERQFQSARKRYWKVRDQYARVLRRENPQLWRMLVPCDPVVTVADDVVFFECFSMDESSYGCLTVERESGFGRSGSLRPGTTNVDYSWQLYEHFQLLRTYRETRLRVDPAGFEVATQGNPDYREEKIDLPPGWLRGFMQIQGAMGLPMRRVSLSREAVYSLLAWLKRHREKTGPRAIRFELLGGKPPALVLEPWEQRIDSLGTKYDGPDCAPVRIWGRRRLMVLSRILPMVESFDVYLLGTGLPSFWVARTGEMRLTLGLSGWTTNDWTRGSALDLLAPPAQPRRETIDHLADTLRRRRAETFSILKSQSLADAAQCAAALNHLAHSGQVIYDLAAGVYRWRQVMPQTLGEAEIGPENAELAASRTLVANRKVTIESQQDAPAAGRLLTGKVDGKPVELLLDSDGGIRRGKCTCSHHYKSGIRMGPCRHLLALRTAALQGAETEQQKTTTDWFQRLHRCANN
jgi:hypothetical protein